METPKHYILRCIIQEREKYPSLGELHAKHIDDIARMMENFSAECAVEIIGNLNNGKTVFLGEYEFEPAKAKWNSTQS